MSERQPTGYRLHSTEKKGLLVEHEDGSHDIGRRAIRNMARIALGKEVLPPQQPNERMGITFTHDDGSYDTGTRAIRNAGRALAGRAPKKYKRTFRPIHR